MTASPRRFLRAEAGSITVEAVIILPVVIWALTATFVFYDSFRINIASQRAAYTVADALSRATEPVNPAFINGMNRLHDILARTENPTAMRVTSIGRDAARNRYIVIWSVPTGGRRAMTNAELAQLAPDLLPDFPQGETVILVETEVDYEPLFRIGIPAQTFRQALVTRPRFAPQVAFDNGTRILFQNFGQPTCDDGGPLCS